MSLRISLLKIADGARAYASDFTDIRTNKLTIRTRTWDGGLIGSGSASDADLELPSHYPVRRLHASDVSSSGGMYELGDLVVDHITPSDGASIGYTPEQLRPTVTSDAVEIIYLVIGSHAGEYHCVELQTYKPFTYRLVLRRTGSTP